MRVLLAREALDDERISELSEPERARLTAIEQARRFGASLGLKRSTSFRHLLDLGADRALELVIAAPPDRLEPVTWWFPIAGRVSYRGYFDPERARSFADQLVREGYDTYLRPAALYSTLGWFDDPIPRRLLSWPEVDVVEVVLHELVHETVFAPGDTNYNEAIASFIAQQATLLLFADRPEPRDQAHRNFADRLRFATLIASLADALRALYAETSSPEEALRLREPIFERFRERVHPTLGWETSRFDGFRTAPLSNAYVVAQQTYLDPGQHRCFAAWLERLDGELAQFIVVQRADPGHRPADVPECEAP